jgi:hypothetical protein
LRVVLRDAVALRAGAALRFAAERLVAAAGFLAREVDVEVLEVFEDREAAVRERAAPPSLPPFRDGEVSVFLPRPEPLFFPPPVSLLTVAHARRSASLRPTPRFS